jgi:AcrR family transcriptional regulator
MEQIMEQLVEQLMEQQMEQLREHYRQQSRELELISGLIQELCEIINAGQPGPIPAAPVPSTTPLEQLNQGASSLVYSPISSDQIRLVKIQPGVDDEIACFLETVDRDKAPAYRVLSYVCK